MTPQNQIIVDHTGYNFDEMLKPHDSLVVNTFNNFSKFVILCVFLMTSPVFLMARLMIYPVTHMWNKIE